MERKRKLPARAAARVEQAAKRRTSTPPADGNTTRSATPALSAAGADDSPAADNGQTAQGQLPKSIQAGKPLPTVEQAQSDDLPASDYQSVQESGVLAESLSRSRQKWISEGIFEKYWAKPSKRRGVAVDDPKNPPKDSMVKLGQITVTVEPHVFEATMYGVKDPKPTPSLPPNVRPIIMYGPSRGTMPPPSATATPPPGTPRKMSQSPSQAHTPAAAAAAVPGTPSQKPPISAPGSAAPAASSTPQQRPKSPPPSGTPQAAPPQSSSVLQPPMMQQPMPGPPGSGMPSIQPIKQETPLVAPNPAAGAPPRTTASPRGMESILSPTAAAGQPLPPARPLVHQSPIQQPSMANPNLRGPSPSMAPAPQAGFATGRSPAMAPTGVQSTHHAPAPAPAPATPRPNAPSRSPSVTTPAPQAPPGTDPIVVMLAEQATHDPELRDLMKRVANGSASTAELDRFQVLLQEITTASKRIAAQGPSADRLFVDGRTVRFFAEEVRIILDIVLRTNPQQTSVDLRPPAGSDPLVVLLVKTALDEVHVREMVRRIGENRPQPSDAADLKAVLDRLRGQVTREQERVRQQQQAATGPSPIAPAGGLPAPAAAPAAPAATAPSSSKANGLQNGHTAGQHNNHQQANSNHSSSQHGAPAQQALRSKGPPPAPKLDVSAVVFEFSGGTGDRYLFPKFSILEYITDAPQQQRQLLQQQQQQQAPTTQEVVASFLIVRKGSKSEYGGDPDLDYYQPVTIRLQAAPSGSSNPRLLEYLSRVVAPVDEVKRYMDNIMNNMTRAEYVLLAMRLPKRELPPPSGEGDASMLEDGSKAATPNSTAGKSNGLLTVGQPQPMEGVLWTATALSASTPPRQKAVQQIIDEDEDVQYHNFIAGLTWKNGDPKYGNGATQHWRRQEAGERRREH